MINNTTHINTRHINTTHIHSNVNDVSDINNTILISPRSISKVAAGESHEKNPSEQLLNNNNYAGVRIEPIMLPRIDEKKKNNGSSFIYR